MEIRYKEQDITNNLLYRAASVLRNYGRYLYLRHAGSEIYAYSVNDCVRRDNGRIDRSAPTIVEIYSSDIKKVYRANGVPLYLGLALTNISAYIHLFIMSMILYIAAPLAFHAEIPQNPVMYFITLAIFIAVSLGAASIIGLAAKDPAKTSMFSIIIFIPSTMLSGIMFPMELLPKALETAGKLFPASWGYQQMTARVLTFENLLPLLLIFVLALVLCSILLRRIDR